MKIFATYNIKGGVGKTATAVNLGYLAARDGYRVLLWDLDPQGAASFLFRIKPRVKGGGKALIHGTRPLDAAIKGTDYDGLDLLPADFTYRNLDLLLDAAKRPERRLASLLAPLKSEYDAVFLDCPPSISLLSESVLHAADLLLVPLIPTTLSVRTLDQLTEFVAGFNGHRPDVLAFFSMIDRRKRLHLQIAAELPGGAAGLRRRGDPGAVGDRADVGAPGAGDRVRTAQPGGTAVRGAVARQARGRDRSSTAARPAGCRDSPRPGQRRQPGPRRQPRPSRRKPIMAAADLVRPLLLGPVPAAGQARLASCRPPAGPAPSPSAWMKLTTGSRSPARNSAGTAIGACCQAPVSSQLRSRLRYQFSGPVKPGRAYCADVGVDVVLGEPGRQLVRLGATSRKPPPAGIERHARRLAGRGRRAPCGRCGRIAAQLGVGDAGLLEVDHVEALAEHRAQGGDRRRAAARPVRARSARSTPRIRSGRNSAVCQATGAPQSWPATTACSSPSASIRAITSPVRCRIVYSPTRLAAARRPGLRSSRAGPERRRESRPRRAR